MCNCRVLRVTNLDETYRPVGGDGTFPAGPVGITFLPISAEEPYIGQVYDDLGLPVGPAKLVKSGEPVVVFDHGQRLLTLEDGDMLEFSMRRFAAPWYLRHLPHGTTVPLLGNLDVVQETNFCLYADDGSEDSKFGRELMGLLTNLAAELSTISRR